MRRTALFLLVVLFAMASFAFAEEEGKTEQEMPNYKGGFSFGPAVGAWVPMADSYLGADFIYRLTLHVGYEISNYRMRLEGGVGHCKIDDDWAILEYPIFFNVIYGFFEGDHGPILGGAVGVHAVSVVFEGDYRQPASDLYWSPMVQMLFGYEFGRTELISFNLHLGYRVLYTNINEIEKYKDKHFPHGIFFGFDMSFF